MAKSHKLAERKRQRERESARVNACKNGARALSLYDGDMFKSKKCQEEKPIIYIRYRF